MATRSLDRIFVGISVVILVASFAAGASASTPTIWRVTVGGATSGSCGSSWGNPCSLQYALASASSGDEIWVEKGVYKPTAGSTRSVSFIVKPGVAVYGGFAGTETARSERNSAANVTVLSGDIDNNDSVDANGVDETVDSTNNGGNSLTVLTMDGTSTPIDASTILDGFTITAGNNDSGSGGGLYCDGTGAECSPKLSNLTFSGNYAVTGGALACGGSAGGTSSPSLTDVTFSGNGAKSDGGAMFNTAQGGTSSPVLDNVDFAGNNAGSDGGAIFNDGELGGTSSPSLTGVTFDTNTAGDSGGAIYDNGDSSSGVGVPGTSSPSLTNVTLYNNSAGNAGGAIYDNANGVTGSPGASSPTFVNVTFNNNSAPLGGAIFNNAQNGPSAPTLTNVILWGDTASTAPATDEIDDANAATSTISYSVVRPGTCGVLGVSCQVGVSTSDPQLGPLQFNGGFSDTIALGAGSSAIDKAEGSPTCPPTDQRGITRPQGAACDIGAYEAQTEPACLPNTSVTFNYLSPLFDTAPAPRTGSGIRSLAAAFQSGQLQTYTVPSDVVAVRITAKGASGGSSSAGAGGLGAVAEAEVPVSGVPALSVVVGSAGTTGTNAGGGGGGSFVFTPGGELLVAAGGGGGSGAVAVGQNAPLETKGGDGEDGPRSGTGGAGGSAGDGGLGGSCGCGGNGGGGGGFLAVGTAGLSSYSGAGGGRISGSPPYGEGGAIGGSIPPGDAGGGGFGGGGGAGYLGGGGGGGFSGGGGGTGDEASDGGGGGGLYLAPGATYFASSKLTSVGDGQVTICVTGRTSVLAIPTLSPWALILLALGLALAAAPMLVRRS